MSDNDANPSPTPRPEDDPPADFTVVDDLTAQTEALAWAAQKLIKGSSPDELLDVMRDEDWPADKAEEIVEQAMAQTRVERGLPDYQAAIGSAQRSYLSGNTGWLVGVPLIGAIRRLLFSLASLRSLRKKDDSDRSNTGQ